jgi:hypothetical protein
MTVIMSMTVTAPDVAEALTAGWDAFRQAAGDDEARMGHGRRHGRGPARGTVRPEEYTAAARCASSSSWT